MHDEDAQRPRVPAIVVTPQTVTAAYQLRAKYRAAGTVALFPAEVLLPLYSLLGDVRALMGAITIAFQALLIAAVLLVIVAVLAGRRQSIGVLRALGAPPGFVVAAAWLEGAVLIGVGVAAGTFLAAIVLHAISDFISVRSGLAVAASLGPSEFGLLGVLAVGGSALAVLPSLSLLWRPVAGLLRV